MSYIIAASTPIHAFLKFFFTNTPHNILSMTLAAYIQYRISPNKRSQSYAKHGQEALFCSQYAKKKVCPILYFLCVLGIVRMKYESK